MEPFQPSASSTEFGLGFSTEDLDSRLTQARDVTGAWGLPPLPDLVQLDLAMAPEIGNVATFLSGVSADVEAAQQPERIDLEYAEEIPEEDPQLARFRALLHESGAERAVRVADQIISPFDPLELPSNTAVERFKLEAVRRGYLPGDTPIDGRWSPELNNLRYEMGYDSFRDVISGNRAGAQDVQGVVRWMRDWLSPTGLLKGAVELDLLWNPGEIADEAANWGEKWGEWFDDPFSAGKLVDALTGPIDDVLLPAVNLALLATGVGQMRLAAQWAFRGAQAVQAAENVYRVSRYGKVLEELSQGGRLARGAAAVGNYSRGLVRAETFAADVNSLQAPGILATAFQRGAGSSIVPNSLQSAFRTTGEAMAGWRSLRSTVLTKQATRQVMRMGFASRLENAILPNRERGAVTVGDFGLQAVSDHIETNAAANTMATIGELFFTPVSVWTPGSVVRPVFRGARENVEKVASLTATLAADEVASGIDTVLDDLVSVGRVSREKADAFRRAQMKYGPGEALVEFYGSRESAGLQVLWYRTLAAVDSKVDSELSTLGILPTESRHEDLRRLMRANYVGQIRDFDEDNLEQIAAAWAISEAAGVRSPKSRLKLFRQITGALEGEAADGVSATADFLRSWARSHNDNRATFVQGLLDNEGAVPGIVRNYMSRSGVLDVFEPERFHDFLIASSLLYDFERATDLSGVRIAAALTDEGRQVSVMSPKRLDEDLAGHLRRTGTMPTQELARKVDPLLKDFKDPSQRLTLGRSDGVWKQDYVIFHNRVRRAVRQLDEIEKLRRDPKVRQFLDDLARHVDTAEAAGDPRTRNELVANFIHEATVTPPISPTNGKPFTYKAERAVKLLAKLDADFDLDAAYALARARLDELDASPDWSMRYGVANIDDTGQVVDVRKKLKLLRQRTKYVAAKVDMESLDLPAETRAAIERSGYTVVTGVEFLEPVDLLLRTNPMADVAQSIVRRATLSSVDPSSGMADNLEQLTLVRNPLDDIVLPDDPTAADRLRRRLKAKGYRAARMFERQDGSLVGGQMRARFERELLRELQALKSRGGFTGDVAGLESADFRAIVMRVDEAVRRLQELATEHLDSAYANRGPLGRMRARVDALDAPQSLRDLSFRQLKEAFADDTPLANAVLRAAKRSRDIGFQYKGLSTIEDRIRSETALQNSLRASKFFLPFGAAYGAATVYGGMSDDERSLWDAIPGVFAGLGSAALLRRPAGQAAFGRLVQKAGNLGQDSEWFRFSMLGENVARLRDYARFALSPYFDLSRYTEGLVMAQTHRLPEGAKLPVLNSARSYARRHGDEAWQRVLDEFREAQHGRFDFDALDSLQKWFQERGLFGYNPTERMAAAFGELRLQGVDPDVAFTTAKDIFTYGTQGRSAAELSVNFIFFPFSFQKKYLTSVGRWMTDDLTRTVVMTDMLRMYEILDERYELGEFLKEHVPALEMLRELNALSFGLSPGQFGGINRPFIDTGLGLADQVPVLGETLDPIQNLFLPQAVVVDGVDAAEALKESFRRTLPAVNDIQKLWRVARDQQYVVTSPNHQTPSADAREAWQEWRDFKGEVDRMLRDAGYSGIRSVYSDPDLEVARSLLQQKKSEIMQAHPAWMESIAEVVSERALLAEEMNTILGKTDPSPAEAGLVHISTLFDQAEQGLSGMGVSFTENPEDIPEEIFQALRGEALRMHAALGGTASEEAGRFLVFYERFFEDLLGPITRELR